MLHFVIHVSKAETGVPLEVFHSHVLRIEGQFHTFVLYLSQIGGNLIETGERRKRTPHNHILGFYHIAFQRAGDAVVQETEVQAHVVGFALFPLQVRICHTTDFQVFHLFQIARSIQVTKHLGTDVKGSKCQIRVVNGTVSVHPPRESQFTHTHWLPLEEFFVGKSPCQGYRGECGPRFFLSEGRIGIAANGGGNHVAVIVRVEQTSQQTYSCTISIF